MTRQYSPEHRKQAVLSLLLTMWMGNFVHPITSRGLKTPEFPAFSCILRLPDKILCETIATRSIHYLPRA
jgi:hypothetical protein